MAAVWAIIVELGILATLRFGGMKTIPSILSICLIFGFSIVYIISLGQKKNAKAYQNALLFGYLFRIALLFFDIYGKSIFTLPNSGFDSAGYFYSAVQFANGFSEESGGFTMTMGFLFRYCGISVLFGQFIVLLFSVVSMEFAAKSMVMLKLDDKQISKAMWILCMLPNFAILSSIFLRESIVTMFVTLSMYEYISWIKKKREIHFFIAIAFTFCASYYHSGSIAAGVGYLLSRLLYDNKNEKLHFSFGNIISTGVLLFLSVYLLNHSGSNFLGKFQNLDSLEDIANESQHGGSNYGQYVGNSNNLVNMVIYTIPRMFFFLFSPMPWMLRGISDIIAFCFSSCFYLYVLGKTFVFLFGNRKENRGIVLTVFIVVMATAFVFGWGTVNAGTACRHRDKMTAVWAILLGLTASRKSDLQNNHRTH